MDVAEGAFPQQIGRVSLGKRRSDGERLCSHSHEVPVGHPLYWPERMGEYPDDMDPLCLEHAIEQAVSDNGWCEKCLAAEASLQEVAAPTADLVDRVAAAIARSDGLSWTEQCGYELSAVDPNAPEDCDSSTCIAALFEDHDPDWARTVLPSAGTGGHRRPLRIIR